MLMCMPSRQPRIFPPREGVGSGQGQDYSRVANGSGSTSYAYNFICSGNTTPRAWVVFPVYLINIHIHFLPFGSTCLTVSFHTRREGSFMLPEIQVSRANSIRELLYISFRKRPALRAVAYKRSGKFFAKRSGT